MSLFSGNRYNVQWDIDGTTSTLKYIDLSKVAQDTPLQFVGNSDGQQSSSQAAKPHCIAVDAGVDVDNDAYHFVRESVKRKRTILHVSRTKTRKK